MLTKNLRNRSCKRPLCLYTEPRERRLPETHIHIVNKQSLSFLTTIIHHLPSFPPPPATFRPPQRRLQHGNATSPAKWTERRGRTDSDDNANTQDEDEVARQRTCHIVETVTTQVVVTVPAGEPPHSPFSSFTREAGATSP